MRLARLSSYRWSLVLLFVTSAAVAEPGVRARDLGLAPGKGTVGPLNAITDVPGVAVGQVTLIEGETIRTGATVVLPHTGNLYQSKVPAGLAVMNGYGKLAGSTQLRELGEIETPIALTNTLAVAAGMRALIDWTLKQPGNEAVRSVNAVVGETNDGYLNAIRSPMLTDTHVAEALAAAATGPIAEGSVGAGTGTVTLGWKGGIGTSSRVVQPWTIGVLVQTNFGGTLVMDGIPVGRELAELGLAAHSPGQTAEYGSIMIVIATDAPLSSRNLERLARRSFAGLARTGASFSNGSGDYAIAFSNATTVRGDQRSAVTLANSAMSPLFLAVADATEEAILNALLSATDIQSRDEVTRVERTVEALPIDAVRGILERYRR
ncbi:MAG: P1 family peptidase [Pseudomonadota bacterium]